VMTKVGAYAVLRIYTLIFPPQTDATGTLFADLLMPAALVTLAVGAAGILGAGSLARLVAFAAIASMGTLFIAISGFTPESTAAALFYIVHSTLAGATLFLLADLVQARRADDSLRHALPPIAQQGLIAALFFAGAIATAGMPPLSGFLGKLLILDAVRDLTVAGVGMAVIWSTVLATSLITIIGLARAGSTLFWKSHASPAEAEHAAEHAAEHTAEHGAEPLAFVAVFALLAALAVLTIFAGPVMNYMQATASELYDRAAYINAHALGDR